MRTWLIENVGPRKYARSGIYIQSSGEGWNMWADISTTPISWKVSFEDQHLAVMFKLRFS